MSKYLKDFTRFISTVNSKIKKMEYEINNKIRWFTTNGNK